MSETIAKIISDSIRVKEAVRQDHAGRIERIAAYCIASLKKGGTILLCGNGGSAADSQHFAAELVGRFRKERGPLAAVALTTNTSTLTALVNDYSGEIIFARQVEALGRPDDVLIGISTSGRSPNIIAAVRKAKEKGMKTMALTGGDGGSLAGMCDEAFVAPSGETPRIQEAHLLVIHILCELIENGLTP